MPKLFNLRTDPLERADMTSNTYYEWFLPRAYLLAAASGIVEEFLKTFREYPPRQRAASFTIDQALERMKAAMGGGGH
jgi:arylsulfatase